jgi:uncharacterized protein
MRRLLIPCAFAVSACAGVGPHGAGECSAGAAGVPLAYELRSADGARAFLQGSVHLAQDEQATLTDQALDELRRADVLVTELDFDAVSPEAMAVRTAELGLLPAGQRMQDHVAPETWTLFEQRCAAAGVEAAAFQPFEPWVAALSMMGFSFAQTGYTPEEGVELQVYAAERPQRTRGLETLDQQIELFDRLDFAAQEALLRETLEGGTQAMADLQDLFAAWRCGDGALLDAQMTQIVGARPELAGFYEATIFARNRSMADSLVQVMAQEKSAFVVVGALHLVGERGIPALLAKQGYDVVQVRKQPAAEDLSR